MSNHIYSAFNAGRLAMLAAAALAAAPGAQAATTIGQFTGGTGQTPYAKLLTVTCGSNTYGFGTTTSGGASGQGTVFSEKLSTSPGIINVIHSFTGSTTDGGQPLSGLIKVGGFLYGTTQAGGTSNAGTVYKLPIGSCTSPQTTSLVYSFRGTPDGQAPAAALLYQGSLLYGTTQSGGLGYGTVFVCKTTGGCGLIYRFNPPAAPGDGAVPLSSLIYTSVTVGTSTVTGLFGTTQQGGTAGFGTIYAVPLPQTGLDQVLWSFGGSEGAYPLAELLRHTTDLYGTASQGGSGACACGTVFKYVPGLSPTVFHYNFQGAPGDGAYPQAGLVWVPGKTKFYGTTVGGGTSSLGTVFSIAPALVTDGVTFSFDNVLTGSYPVAGLDLFASNLYGTSLSGVGSAPGTVFTTPP